MSKQSKKATWTTDDLPELQKARALWESAPLKALGMFERAAKRHPYNVTALLDAARALGSAHRLPEAKSFLRKVTPYALQSPQGAETLGQSYRMAQMPDEAVDYFKKALRSPNQLESVIELAVYYERRHMIDEAKACLYPALAKHPDLAPLLLLKGRLLRREKDQEMALQLFRQVAQDESAHFYHRAEGSYEVANLEDARGDYRAAYKAACSAKQLMLPIASEFLGMGDVWRVRQQEMQEALTPELIETWKSQTSEKKRNPALLTGCPRSGTTLFEQIIGTHPQIQSFDEFDIFPRYLHGMMLRDARDDDSGRDALLGISDQVTNKARRGYWELFANHVKPTKESRVLFDKNPGVTGQIPVYLRMHPHAKIFYALRDPRDIAVSSFLRFLPMNNVSASYLKPDTTVAWIAEELSLWQSLKPHIPQNQWQEIRYEDTVNDLRGTISEALQFLGLEWDPAIENYRESRATRPVNSPTYLEITQPIHRKSLGRWQNYAFAFELEFEKHAEIFEKLGY